MRSGLVTKDQWLVSLQEARTIEAQRLLASGQEYTSEEIDTALTERMLVCLVESEVLTRYQGSQLRSGRTKLTLGPYLITEWLGQGGMGQVFVGVHKVMGRRCAIKVLPLSKSTEESRDSFLREIQLQGALDCPYLVRAFDAGCDGSVHYLVTEYVPGTDLRQLVKNHGPLSMQAAASIIAQAAAGLAYAHDSGLIHRDVKPANILVTPDGHAKVSDVGLAAWTHGLQDDPRAGKIVGTADYLSPEQIKTPDAVGPVADIYSLGCTLYYACTGKVPYPGGDSRSKCQRHLQQMPFHPRKFAPSLSNEFVETIGDMMEKDASKRIASAHEVVQRLSIWAALEQEDAGSSAIGIGQESLPGLPGAGLGSGIGSGLGSGLRKAPLPAGNAEATAEASDSTWLAEFGLGPEEASPFLSAGAEDEGGNTEPLTLAAVGDAAAQSQRERPQVPPELIPPPVDAPVVLTRRRTPWLNYILLFLAGLLLGGAGMVLALQRGWLTLPQ